MPTYPYTPRNEAAFPRPYSEQQPGDRREFCYAQEGMTMREWYAGQAMIGLLAYSDFEAFTKEGEELASQLLARNAFEIADAMIKEAQREQPHAQ